jgi:hypothetical protein
MVFFSCDGCGEMLKKNQVDAHVFKCKKGCHAVSCVDCSVSFYDGELIYYYCTIERVKECVLREGKRRTKEPEGKGQQQYRKPYSLASVYYQAISWFSKSTTTMTMIKRTITTTITLMIMIMLMMMMIQ